MLWSRLAGGVIAAAFFAVRSVPLPRIFLGEAWALRLHRHDTGIPYGLALAAGALLVYPHTLWFAVLAALKPCRYSPSHSLPDRELVARRVPVCTRN